MHLGFSYIGLIFLIMLMIPNLYWTKNQPKDYEKYVHNENKILLLFERAGEVLVTCLLLIFSDFNIQGITAWMIWLIAAFVLMIMYELYWIRYFKSEKTMKDFYSSIMGIPVAGAKITVTIYLELQEKEKEQDKNLMNLPVLVVDDDKTCCESTVATLKEIGIMGEWVLSGREASG